MMRESCWRGFRVVVVVDVSSEFSGEFMVTQGKSYDLECNEVEQSSKMPLIDGGEINCRRNLL